MPLILINEFARSSIKENPYTYKGVIAINSAKADPQKCTWNCHEYTAFCKAHHVKYLQPYFKYTDQLYFGTINSLKQTGNYGAANLFLFVFAIPGAMLLLIIKSWQFQDQIAKLKTKKK